MDNLTHSLFGLALARSGLAARVGPGASALLVVASNIPDLDAILLLTHREDAAWLRRTHTHCLLGGGMLAVLLGLAWWAAGRRRMKLPHALGLAALGVLGHVGMDLLNSYGVVALWPFLHERFELASVFIIDLAMLAILVAPLLLARLLRGRMAATTLSRAALVALAAYVAGCALARARATAILADLLAREEARPSFTYVFPEALGPHRWRGVAREDDRWRLWLLHVTGEAELIREARTADEEPDVRVVRASPRGRQVERFFKAPVWTVDAARTQATCTDLRFFSAVLGGRRPTFEYEFQLRPARAE